MAKASPEVRKGTCPVCGTGCHVLVHVTDGKVTRVEADTRSGFRPRGCVRVAAAVDYHDHPSRLNYPLKRVGGRGEARWQRVPWEQAMDEIAARLAEIRDRYGPEAVAVLGGSPHGPGDPAAWKWCNLWGTPNFMHQGKNCGEAEILAECAIYGYRASRSDVVAGTTRVAVLWGANTADSGAGAWTSWLEAKSRGTKLVVVDPRPSASAKDADIWVRLRPGTDGALALGMLNVIINEGLYDQEFVARWCLGFEEVRQLVQMYPPSRVAETTGVPEEQIVEVARLYATLHPALLAMGVATCHTGKGALSAVIGKSWLRAITGNLDIEGGNRFGDWPEYTAFLDEINWDSQIYHPLRKKDNVSAHEWPIASVKALALYREAMQRVYPKGYGGAQYFIYPGPHYIWKAILEGDPYPIKAVFDQGTNSLCCLGNGKLIYRALKTDNLELHVSMDHFLTPTGALADYVLPASDSLERSNMSNLWGLSNSYYGREKAVEPLYERRDDYRLWRDLGVRLGQEGWPDTVEGWFDRLLAPAGVSFKDFSAGQGYVPPRTYKRYEQKGFGTFSGKVELVPSIFTRLGYNPLEGFQEPAWGPVSTPDLAKEYPLILIAGSRVRPYTHSSQRQLDKLRQRHPYPLLQIAPETAARLSIAQGDTVYIETPLGTVRQKAQLLEGMHPQVVHADGYWWFPEQPEADPCLFGVWDSNINSIIPDDPEVCDYTGDNLLRALLCRVYKAKDFT